MKTIQRSFFFLTLISFIIAVNQSWAQSTLDCSLCHSSVTSEWALGPHSDTQNDVADELGEEWAGLPPDSVILGQDAENCIACHGAGAVAANGGMTETEALSYFFSTANGLFSSSTQALNTDEWPHNGCISCHNVPDDHPSSMPTLGLFNSYSNQYEDIGNTSLLCGQCHGTLRFPDTDHRRLAAWLLSGHGHGGQDDVAEELAGELAGSTPAEVAAEENCIACHAPTSVLMNGGMTEAEALSLFFTTESGQFTASTVSQNSEMWAEVACTSCHNQHDPDGISYFNSATQDYEDLPSAQELCGKCHGNLRFPDTDHLSYNLAQGSGGIDVDDMQTMSDIQCVDCHMHSGDVDDTNAAMYGGHLWSVFIEEEDGSVWASCISCHTSSDVGSMQQVVEEWQTEFATLDSAANANVEAAVEFLIGSTDSALLQQLEEAQFNLAFAEGDESGGVHNHNYTIALLNSAIAKSTTILADLDNGNRTGVKTYALYQNYPNPFNPSTTISYQIPDREQVTLTIYNLLGGEISVLVNKAQDSGYYSVQFDGINLPSGVYFYRLQIGDRLEMKRMLLLR
ncbi:MAG: ammonia-forming cytochrome c nitrite reductase subunit c552 [Candidatus Marinimicrobia bacterium]|nr:ammonia-forming cytochrome c nitrite reductase subunit c552 [Candidatus Neomarinimicrobiota bacterium]